MKRALASFVGPGIDPDAGLQPPSSGEQRVEWAEVVQERELTPGRPGARLHGGRADRRRGPAVPDG